MASNRDSTLIGTAAVVLIVLLLIGGGAYWAYTSLGQGGTTPPAPQRQIKVGFILSQATATGPSWVRSRYPQMVRKAFEECLAGAPFDLYPVIEPGTAQSAELQPILSQHFAGKTPIECSDDAQMSTLDVLFAHMVMTASPDMTAAFEKHVRDQGKGLYLRIGYGLQGPGFTPEILPINAMKQAVYGWNGSDQLCRIVAQHPATADVGIGTQLMVEPNGAWGIPDGEALALVDNAVIEPLGATPPDTSSFVFAPFRVGQFGKGRVFVAAYLGINNSDGTLRALRQINADGVRWAAGQAP